MIYSSSVLLVLSIVASASTTKAFSIPRQTAYRTSQRWFATPDEELTQSLYNGNLRQAAQILEQNPLIELSRETFGKVFDCIEQTTEQAEENSINTRLVAQQQQAQYPPQSPARMDMTRMYQTLRDNGKLTFFGAGEAQPIASGSKTVTPLLLEEITNLSMTSLTPKPNNSLLFAGIALATAEALCALTLGWNLNAMVFLTLLAALVDRAFVNGAVFETIIRTVQPKLQSKILRHEAGHFLCAYLLGCPVEGCVLSGWAALQDARFDKRQVTAGTSFFDPALSREMNSGRVTRGSIDRYSVIVMAGIAAEAMNFGGADGGAGDEMALVAFLSQLNTPNNASKSTGQVWNNVSIRNQARWGALQAVLLLREYKACYDGLVDALERGGNLGDCIYAIEQAGRDAGLKPMTRPLGWILDQGDYGMWSTNPPPAEMTLDPPGAKSLTIPPRVILNDAEAAQALIDAKQFMENRLNDINEKLKSLDE